MTLDTGLAGAICAQVAVGLLHGEGREQRATGALEVIGLFVLNAVRDGDRAELERFFTVVDRADVVGWDRGNGTQIALRLGP